MSMEIHRDVWFLEPNDAHRSWPAIATKLRSRPGEWACVGIAVRSLAWKLTSGGIPAINPDEFEAVAKRGPGGEHLLWVRYIPDPTTPDPDPAEALTAAIKALTDALDALKAVTA